MSSVKDNIKAAIVSVLSKYDMRYGVFLADTRNSSPSKMPPQAAIALQEIIHLSVITCPGMLQQYLGYSEKAFRNLDEYVSSIKKKNYVRIQKRA